MAGGQTLPTFSDNIGIQTEGRKAIFDLQNQIKKDITIATAGVGIPIGFTYLQLPGYLDPNQLFDGQVWDNITSLFAGLFFRAEGGNSNSFGSGQQLDAMQGHYHNRTFTDTGHAHTARQSTNSGWGATSNIFTATIQNNATGVNINTNTTGIAISVTSPLTDGVNGTPRTAIETRPINCAIRIWVRSA